MCQGADKRPDAPESVVWHVAMKPGKRKVLDKTTAIGRLKELVGEGQGQRARQGRTPLPCEQASVREREGSQSGADEEHGAAEDPVRPVDGTRTNEPKCARSRREGVVRGLGATFPDLPWNPKNPKN